MPHTNDIVDVFLTRYPVAYSIIVLPLSVVRWLTFSKVQGCGRSSIPSEATFVSVFLHGCFGFVNVVLLLTTRQALLLFDDPRNPSWLRLRRAAGSALVDWDDELRVDGDRSAKKASSSSRRARGCKSSKRAASLDSGRDVLGIMEKESGEASRSDSMPSMQLLSVNQIECAAMGDNLYGRRFAALQQHHLQHDGRAHVLTQSHLISSSGGLGQRSAGGGIAFDEYSDEEIAKRLAHMVPGRT